MKIILIVIWSFASLAGAAVPSKVTCTIDMPCGWLTSAPVEPYSYLGFCVDRIEGTPNELTVHRSDGNGGALDPVLLTVQTFNNESILAVNRDKSIELNVSLYDQGLAGGILFKTERNPDGLGLFAFCEVQ